MYNDIMLVKNAQIVLLCVVSQAQELKMIIIHENITKIHIYISDLSIFTYRYNII